MQLFAHKSQIGTEIIPVFFFVSVLALAVFLGGCGDDATDTEEAANQATTNNASTNNASTNNASTNNLSTPTGPVDPNCVDGQYAEVRPSTTDLSAEVDSYDPEDVKGFILSVLDKRYPIGAHLVRGGLEDSQIDCVEFFLSDASTAQAVIGSLSTIVHECGHIFDLRNGRNPSDYFALTDTLVFECRDGDTTERGGKTFARSRITGDDLASGRPACGGAGFGSGCDGYAGVYLDGDPDDGNFEGGDQGFNSVVEETVQYVNSLAVGLAFLDFRQSSVSERDGILTFLWYIGRYLRFARGNYPDAYEAIVSDSCYRRLILSVWGRAWLYLEWTNDYDKLGIDDEAIEALVMDGVILDEIQRIRDAEGCE
jgi:hypothetical protein